MYEHILGGVPYDENVVPRERGGALHGYQMVGEALGKVPWGERRLDQCGALELDVLGRVRDEG
jgi:hypothetical protein